MFDSSIIALLLVRSLESAFQATSRVIAREGLVRLPQSSREPSPHPGPNVSPGARAPHLPVDGAVRRDVVVVHQAVRLQRRVRRLERRREPFAP